MENLFEGNNWENTRAALLEGLAGTKRDVMSSVLENTKKALNENATAGGTQAGNIATLNKVILPVIRRVMPTVIANEIIGVQPMTGPVGQIHTLRVRYSDTAAGVTAGAEALSPFDIAKNYSGDANGAPAATASPLPPQAMIPTWTAARSASMSAAPAAATLRAWSAAPPAWPPPSPTPKAARITSLKTARCQSAS